MKIKKIIALFTLLLFGWLLMPLTADAITISPPIIELEAAKGDIIQQSLKVRNEENRAVTYYLSAERFIATGETGAPEFIGEDVGLATWIKFPYKSISIPAGETIELPFAIEVPNYASPGGHYAVVFLSTVPPETTKETSQVAIAAKIGSLILVKIAGDIKESAAISEFKTVSDTYASLPIDFYARVENNGNTHIKPRGTILIKNMWGSVAGSVAVNEQGGNVLPDQIRKFEASWVKNPNSVGATTFWGKYRQQKENYAFGRYKADLTLNYGTAGKVLTASTNFWVIPWHVIIVNLFILIIIAGILYFGIKKYNTWLIKNYSKIQKKKK
ncbi:MAG TPA: hypothetical protein ENN28_01950 [Candidatus Uhrbacteria bacterium]|nr:hypothetical protein [Candidatus Uhrbacteria bacterium]